LLGDGLLSPASIRPGTRSFERSPTSIGAVGGRPVDHGVIVDGWRRRSVVDRWRRWRVVDGRRRSDIHLTRRECATDDGADTNTQVPALTAERFPACTGAVSEIVAMPTAITVTVTLEALCIGEPSACRDRGRSRH